MARAHHAARGRLLFTWLDGHATGQEKSVTHGHVPNMGFLGLQKGMLFYLDPKDMQNNGPAPLTIAPKWHYATYFGGPGNYPQYKRSRPPGQNRPHENARPYTAVSGSSFCPLGA